MGSSEGVARPRQASAVRLGPRRRPLGVVGLVSLVGLAGLLIVPNLPPTRAEVVLQLGANARAGGAPPLAPLSGASIVTGVGACVSYANGTVPFGPGSARANATVTEPRGCPGRTPLTFLPPARFTNGLPVPRGHVLRSSLTLLSMNGSTTMFGRALLYLQHVGGGNGLITNQLLVRNGVIVTAQTTGGTVASPNLYGIGLRLTLNHLATSSRATLDLMLVTYLDDGGIVRVLDQQRVTVLVVY